MVMHSRYLGIGALGLALAMAACSSSTNAPAPSDAGAGSDGSTPGVDGGAGTATGTCAALKACCPLIANQSDQNGCDITVNMAGNNQGVCTDGLNHYGSMCGLDGGGVTPGGDAGNTCPGGPAPADIPAACAAVAGACVGPETPPSCLEYSGGWTNIVATAQQQCTGRAGHQWMAAMSCAQAVPGIIAGCESNAGGSGLCTTTWYSAGCISALGSSCNSQSAHGQLWVHP